MKDLSTRTSALFTDCTRDKILKNSLELFNRKGFVSVTTSLLASSAKVREGTLWYHFKSKKSLDPDIQRLENDLTSQLGAKVTIKHKKSGAGTLSIKYSSTDELEGILSKIK